MESEPALTWPRGGFFAIAEQVDRQIPLALLAQRLGIPERRLNTFCWREFGASPGRFLRSQRILRAHRALIATARPAWRHRVGRLMNGSSRSPIRLAVSR